MKKILIFCLYCVVFTLLPAVSILAQGGKDNSKKKPFPALDAPAEEGDTFYLSEVLLDDSDSDETSLVSETTVVPETTAVNKDEPLSSPEIMVVNEDKPSPVLKAAPVNEDRYPSVPQTAAVIDRYSRSSADANTAASATESTASAAESAAAAAQFAAAAAQSARVAESAAATATAAAASVNAAAPHQAPPSQAQPPVVQPQPAPSRVPPQPPARTVVPTVNIIVPQTAPPAAATPPPSAAPPAYRPSMNVTPGMPDPYSNGVYRVQLGSFSNTGLAQQCFNRLKAAGFTPFYEQYGSLYRVVISGIQAADMAGVIRRLEAAGFTDAWIREER